MQDTPALRFSNVRFTYDGIQFALDGLTFTVKQGEFVAILGGNGSGKSTLAKHINALLYPDEGAVQVFDWASTNKDYNYDIKSTAGMVFQNPDDQLVASIVENEIAFGPENLGVPALELRERVTESLLAVGLVGFEEHETYELSGGQKQRVALAGVLAMHPRILVLDEASAMLDPRGRIGLMKICHSLHAQGMTIIMITHFMEEAAQADRVIVMQSGKIALDAPPSEVLAHDSALQELSLEAPFAVQLCRALQKHGVKVPLTTSHDALIDWLASALSKTKHTEEALLPEFHSAVCDEPSSPPTETHPAITFDDVSYSYQTKKTRSRTSSHETVPVAQWGKHPCDPWALEHISFTVTRGEFFGIAGHTGSGKSTLIQLINGLFTPTEGIVQTLGHTLKDARSAQSIRGRVGIVFQYPERQLFAPTVFEDVTFGPKNLSISGSELEERYVEAMQSVGLDATALKDVSPFELSGGQQRRVAFAGILAMKPEVLVFDEPVAGLDPLSRKQFLDLICTLRAREGLTIVMVSHDMNDLARLCDHVLVLNQGRQHALGTPVEVFSNEAGLRDIGLGIPDTSRTIRLLASRGISLDHPQDDFSVEGLARSLSQALDAAQ